jgi:4-amino-4-deoxy-L-arabinose transferase-like glycosyltransferase
MGRSFTVIHRFARRVEQGVQIDWAVVVVLSLAAFLRLVYLGQIPACLEYDEAANVILAGEIAQGKAFPVFIRPYTGKEVLYFYLAAGVMRLGGVSPFSLRLTSAFLGMLNVALTYWLARRLLGCGRGGVVPSLGCAGRWIALFSAALVAVSYWQVNLSRFGYRAIVLPPLLALCMGSLLHGLVCSSWAWIAAAGAWAGLSAYTYASVRVLPVLLLLVWLWILVTDRRRWRLRLGQLALFGAAALLVFAPLGLFFLRNPETFTVRLDQVSVLSPSVHKGDPWGALWRTIRLALGMFTISGDQNPLYNFPGKPVFDRILGPFFYLGLLFCLWGLFAPRSLTCLYARSHQSDQASAQSPNSRIPQFPSFLLLSWLLIMMIPNVLSASGVPHNLRAMALVPAVHIVAAVGIVGVVEVGRGILPRRHGEHGGEKKTTSVGSASPWFFSLLLLLLLVYEGARTYGDYVRVWAPSAAPYYKGNQALIGVARLLNAHPEADPYIATYFQQHATLAVTARGYEHIRWMSGQTLVLPPPGGSPALLVYDHTTPIDPLLRERLLPPNARYQRELGPDGEVGFEAYWVSDQRPDSGQKPGFSPQMETKVNLGHTLTFLGYDLNAPVVSGGLLDVTLYFEVQRAVEQRDWTFFLHLADDLGFHWGGETFFHYPSIQWRAGEVMAFRQQIDVAPGAPPGDYVLDVGVFAPSLDARMPVLDETGQMTGTTFSIGPIAVERAVALPAALPAIQQPQQEAFADALLFLGSDRDRSDLRPGETLALTLYWQAGPAVVQAGAVSVWLSGAEGDIPLWDGDPVHGLYPFAQWQPAEFVRDRYALRLPLDLVPGEYDLRLAVLDGQVSLGVLHVHASDRLWESPPFDHPVDARLGQEVELLGYNLSADTAAPGDTLHLTLIWRSRSPMDRAYTVFTHLLDAAEQVRGQKDNPPVRGTYPTTLWVPGEVIVDEYEIVVAASAAPGPHVIEVGMYDPVTMARLPVLDPTGTLGDRVLLGRVQVVAER